MGNSSSHESTAGKPSKCKCYHKTQEDPRCRRQYKDSKKNKQSVRRSQSITLETASDILQDLPGLVAETPLERRRVREFKQLIRSGLMHFTSNSQMETHSRATSLSRSLDVLAGASPTIMSLNRLVEVSQVELVRSTGEETQCPVLPKPSQQEADLAEKIADSIVRTEVDNSPKPVAAVELQEIESNARQMVINSIVNNITVEEHVGRTTTEELEALVRLRTKQKILDPLVRTLMEVNEAMQKRTSRALCLTLLNMPIQHVAKTTKEHVTRAEPGLALHGRSSSGTFNSLSTEEVQEVPEDIVLSFEEAQIWIRQRLGEQQRAEQRQPSDHQAHESPASSEDSDHSQHSTILAAGNKRALQIGSNESDDSVMMGSQSSLQRISTDDLTPQLIIPTEEVLALAQEETKSTVCEPVTSTELLAMLRLTAKEAAILLADANDARILTHNKKNTPRKENLPEEKYDDDFPMRTTFLGEKSKLPIQAGRPPPIQVTPRQVVTENIKNMRRITPKQVEHLMEELETNELEAMMDKLSKILTANQTPHQSYTDDHHDNRYAETAELLMDESFLADLADSVIETLL